MGTWVDFPEIDDATQLNDFLVKYMRIHEPQDNIRFRQCGVSLTYAVVFRLHADAVTNQDASEEDEHA
jgi:hypothetical protein